MLGIPGSRCQQSWILERAVLACNWWPCCCVLTKARKRERFEISRFFFFFFHNDTLYCIKASCLWFYLSLITSLNALSLIQAHRAGLRFQHINFGRHSQSIAGTFFLHDYISRRALKSLRKIFLSCKYGKRLREDL